MGVVKISYYTVRCNRCNDITESSTGDLMTRKRTDAEEIARECGYLQIGKNTWLCPECQKEMN